MAARNQARACKLGLQGIVSKRKDFAYRRPIGSKLKNADAPAVKREEQEEWGNNEWAMNAKELDHDLRPEE
jgi:hypothetical protein